MMAHWDGDHLKWVVVTFFYSFRWVNIIQLGAVFEELIALIGKTSQDLILMKWMLVKVRKRRQKFSANQSIFGKILFRLWNRYDENDDVYFLNNASTDIIEKTTLNSSIKHQYSQDFF